MIKFIYNHLTNITGFSYVAVVNILHVESVCKISISVIVGGLTATHLYLQIRNQIKKKKIFEQLINNSKK
jgi:hypothetical protein